VATESERHSVIPRTHLTWACLLLATSCNRGDSPQPQKDDPVVVTSTTPSATQSARVEAPAPPTLTLERLESDERSISLHPIQGALAVAAKQRVGRVTGDRIEWLDARIPEGSLRPGSNEITAVYGRWPDSVDVVFSNVHSRVPVPTYYPLTGNGHARPFAEGGGMGWVTGVARVGDRTIVAGFSFMEGEQILAVRGEPAGLRHLSKAEAGCKETEKATGVNAHKAGVWPLAFQASEKGTLISLGRLCGEDVGAAEVWDVAAKTSRIVKLGHLIKKVETAATILQGKGDVLWLLAGGDNPIVEYRDGDFHALPQPSKKPIDGAFASAEGELHASDSHGIYRLEGGKWLPIAHFAWPLRSAILARHEGAYWAAFGGAVWKLNSGSSLAFEQGCTTPFVFLYTLPIDSKSDFTFPATQKALATFPEVAKLRLVEVDVGGDRRLGVVVMSKAQGEAVIAHLKATMKDEDPRLLCYAPDKAREIPMTL
jgi:hypothetical protein